MLRPVHSVVELPLYNINGSFVRDKRIQENDRTVSLDRVVVYFVNSPLPSDVYHLEFQAECFRLHHAVWKLGGNPHLPAGTLCGFGRMYQVRRRLLDFPFHTQHVFSFKMAMLLSQSNV